MFGDRKSSGVDRIIENASDWRGTRLSELRDVILGADPQITESVKWVKPSNPNGVPTWSSGVLICTGEVYANKLKFTFAHGAALDDPSKLFNNGFSGSQRRAIDVHDGDSIDLVSFSALIKAAMRVKD